MKSSNRFAAIWTAVTVAVLSVCGQCGEIRVIASSEEAAQSAAGFTVVSMDEDASYDDYEEVDTADISGEIPESYTTIEINSIEDFEAFAENCHYDDWSEDKLVLLNVDLDFGGEEFAPVATFGGIFDGQDHTISGISITNAICEAGLFGTIRNTGTVMNLHVEGTIAPEGSQSTIGGIAGLNYGTISGCTFSGSIEAQTEVGGIVGRNRLYGTITGCSAEGTITASSGCGGIAGYNEGTIDSCENAMDVNTVYQDTAADMDELTETLEDLISGGTSLISTDELSDQSDHGGIAGYSSGVIVSCINRGNVGYEHVGYNVGGIVGRSSGFLSGNINYGEIYGRKDVGGIVGQMQPYLFLEFTESSFDAVEEEMDRLGDLVDDMLNDVDSMSEEVSNRMQNISGLMDIAEDALSVIGEESLQAAEDMTESMNDAAATLQEALEGSDTGDVFEEYMDTLGDTVSSMADIDYEGTLTEYMEETVSSVEDLLEELAAAIPQLSDYDLIGEGAQEAAAQLQEFLESLFGENNDLTADTAADSEDLSTAIQTFIQYLATYQAAESNLENLQSSLESMLAQVNSGDFSGVTDGLGSVISGIESNVEILEAALSQMEEIISEFSPGSPDLSEMADSIRAAGDAISDTDDLIDSMESMISVLASIDLQTDGVSETLQANGTVLYDALRQLTEEMETLGNSASGQVSGMSEDIREIMDQFDAVLNAMTASMEELTGDGEEDGEYYEDVSDEDLENTYTGRTSGCVNYGEVNADINGGGIVGMIGVEYSLDPESDVEISGSAALNYVFQVSSIVDDCVNRGTVSVRSRYAGGIAGHMEMGLLAYCVNYGTLSCEDGKYVGGITGYSAGTVRDCAAKCAVDGSSYAGGIAGYGTTLRDNIALVEMQQNGQFVGAIAGDADNIDSEFISGNYCYSGEVYGIGGISYRGIAESISYEELMALEGVPEEFEDLVLTFVAEDAVVAVITCEYGETIEEGDLPQVPEKEGFYGVWSRTEYESVTADETIRAEYTRYLTLLGSVQTRENGQFIIEADGSFLTEAELTVTEEEPEGEELERWSVVIPDDGASEHQVRFLVPDTVSKESVRLYLIADGTKTAIETAELGDYLIFTAEGNEITFAVESEDERHAGGILLLSAAVLLLALILWRILRKRR